jgi:hypothetical protein
MRNAILILFFLHGSIHLLGFVKGLGLGNWKGADFDVSRWMGWTWLLAALFCWLFTGLAAAKLSQAWWIGLLALLLSQILIVCYWKAARFGTLPNVLLLAFCVSGLARQRFQERVAAAEAVIQGAVATRDAGLRRTDALAQLPAPVSRWLRQTGVLDKPPLLGGRLEQHAFMQMKPGQASWLEASAVQHTRTDEPAFLWAVDVPVKGLFHLLGMDRYKAGKGAMHISVHGLFPIVNAEGPKLDEGTLQRFLGEMVWFPDMALAPYIRWEAVDDSTARAHMAYGAASAAGTFHFGPAGEVKRFSALRFQGNEPDARRFPWIMEIQEHRVFDGIRIPSRMTSTWKLDSGDWTWLKLELTRMDYRYATAGSENNKN